MSTKPRVHYWVSCPINKGGFFEIAFVVDTHLPRFEAIAYVLPHFDALCVCWIFKSVQLYFVLSFHILSMVRHCLWKMCATPGARINETGLWSSAVVVRQSEFPELCSSAAVMLQSKSTELCSSAAVVPKNKPTELCSSATVVRQSKSAWLCSSVAVVPQSKSTELTVARRPLCHKLNLPSCVARQPLCHKANLPSCVARRLLCNKVNLPRCEAWWRHFVMTYDIFGTGQTNI